MFMSWSKPTRVGFDTGITGPKADALMSSEEASCQHLSSVEVEF